MSLALRNLLQDRLRTLLSVAGVALAIMLILVLTGFVSGLNLQVSRYLDNAPGSIVLVQAGTSGTTLVTPTNTLPESTATAARAVPGVARAVPVLSQYAVLALGEARQFVVVIGYDSALGGGPWSLRQGRGPSADNEVVMDGVLADRRGVRLNDSFQLMGRTFKVVGLSDGSTTWMTSYIFMRLDAAQRLYGTSGLVTMVLVTPAPEVASTALLGRLDALPGADARLKSDVIDGQRSFYLSTLGAPLRLMAGIAALVGTLVVGLVVYTATVEKQREFGLIKAVGARNRYLYRVVAIQALFAALAGALAGLPLALGVAWLIMQLRPQFLIAIEPASALIALAAALVMALAAALIPGRMIARLAPAEVFRR